MSDSELFKEVDRIDLDETDIGDAYGTVLNTISLGQEDELLPNEPESGTSINQTGQQLLKHGRVRKVVVGSKSAPAAYGQSSFGAQEDVIDIELPIWSDYRRGNHAIGPGPEAFAPQDCNTYLPSRNHRFIYDELNYPYSQSPAPLSPYIQQSTPCSPLFPPPLQPIPDDNSKLMITDALSPISEVESQPESRDSSPMFKQLILGEEEDIEKARILNDIRHLLVGVLEDEQRSRKLVESVGEDAQLWLDTLQVLAKLPGMPSWIRSSKLKTMLHLSKQSGLFPQCLTIKNVEKLGDYPVGGGSFGDVWKGRIGDQIVGLKVVKTFLTSNVQKLLRDYMREAILWQELEHPNLLPFMGIYYLNDARTQLCLVSPWMEQGNLTKYLENVSREAVDHYLLVYDVASGLAYLHSRKIVHGDLKGVNVLITPDGRACIGDFGLSRVADSRAINLTSSTTSSTGTIRWSSPELLMPPFTPTTFSDMYAFAGVCYEILTGNVPFYGFNDGGVMYAVMVEKKHPSRPDSTLLNDEMWDSMVECWNTDPQLRPVASVIVDRVAGLVSSKTGRACVPAPQWDVSNLNQIWKDVRHPALDMEALRQLHRNLESLPLSPIVLQSARDVPPWRAS